MCLHGARRNRFAQRKPGLEGDQAGLNLMLILSRTGPKTIQFSLETRSSRHSVSSCHAMSESSSAIFLLLSFLKCSNRTVSVMSFRNFMPGDAFWYVGILELKIKSVDKPALTKRQRGKRSVE